MDWIDIPPCPKCGSDEDVYVTGQSRGPVKAWFDSHGLHYETEADQSWFLYSKIVRCGKCMKKRNDLEFHKAKYLRIIRKLDVND